MLINSYRFATATAPWTPAQISTTLWLDAADATTIILNGSAVSQWNDKSGNARHASQATPANQPAYNATAFNNRPTLVFDGSSDFMTTTAYTAPATLTCVAVATLLSAGSYPQLLSNAALELRGVATSAKPSFVVVGNNRGAGVDAIPATPVATTDSLLNTTNILIGQVVSTTSTLRQNGSLRDTESIGDPVTPLNVSRFIGTRSGLGFYASARISELIELGAASTEVQERIEGYLAHKWGLTADLPADHPYKSAAPTV